MDRSIVYPEEQGRSTDFLFAQRSGLIALSKLAAALFGQQNFVNGLAVSPSSPAALTVQVGPGEMYAMEDVDATAYGVLAADTTHQILKQGILLDAATLSCAAPTTSGYSINYLIEASFVEADTANAVLPYFNSANPAQPLSGQNNSGTPQATERQGQVQLVAKAGTAATTGTQSTPAPDSGYVGLAVVSVAYGQTTITSANIATYTGNPSIPAAGALSAIRNGFYTKNVAGNANVTLDPDGEAPYPIIKLTGALTGNINLYLPANGQWLIQNETTGAYTVTATTTGGVGVSVPQGATSVIFGDGTNINSLGLLTQTAADTRYGPLKLNTISAATTLNSTYQGSLNNITAAVTATLPSLATLTAGQAYEFEFESEVINAPVACNAADTMTVNGATGLTSFKMNPGSTLRVIGVGGAAGAWVCKYTPGAEVFDNTASTSDIVLHVGEACSYTFSTISQALHIATGTHQEYEIFITQEGAQTATAANPNLQPNNTTYASAFIVEVIDVAGNGNNAVSQQVSTSSLYLGANSDTYYSVRSNVVTGTYSKLADNSQWATVGGTVRTDISKCLWNDTTTAWTSLGTLTMNVAASWRTQVRRIA